VSDRPRVCADGVTLADTRDALVSGAARVGRARLAWANLVTALAVVALVALAVRVGSALVVLVLLLTVGAEAEALAPFTVVASRDTVSSSRLVAVLTWLTVHPNLSVVFTVGLADSSFKPRRSANVRVVGVKLATPDAATANIAVAAVDVVVLSVLDRFRLELAGLSLDALAVGQSVSAEALLTVALTVAVLAVGGNGRLAATVVAARPAVSAGASLRALLRCVAGALGVARLAIRADTAAAASAVQALVARALAVAGALGAFRRSVVLVAVGREAEAAAPFTVVAGRHAVGSLASVSVLAGLAPDSHLSDVLAVGVDGDLALESRGSADAGVVGVEFTSPDTLVGSLAVAAVDSSAGAN
jgi:hypothetical protein